MKKNHQSEKNRFKLLTKPTDVTKKPIDSNKKEINQYRNNFYSKDTP